MQHMRLIDALDRTKSLSDAARFLHISQPAASKALRDAEFVAGQQMFERSAHGVKPTTAGLIIIRYAQRMLADIGKLDEELDRLERPGGGVCVIGALPVAAAGMASPIIQQILDGHDELELRLEEGRLEALLPRLISGELDVILGRLYEPELPDGLIREPLYDEPIALVAHVNHPAFEQNPNNLDFSDFRLLLPTFSQRLGRETEHYLSRVEFPLPRRRIRATSHMLIREMLHETDMITVIPQLLVAGDLRRGSLKVLPVKAAAAPRPAGLLFNPARASTPNIQLIINVTRATIARGVELASHGIGRLP